MSKRRSLKPSFFFAVLGAIGTLACGSGETPREPPELDPARVTSTAPREERGGERFLARLNGTRYSVEAFFDFLDRIRGAAPSGPSPRRTPRSACC